MTKSTFNLVIRFTIKRNLSKIHDLFNPTYFSTRMKPNIFTRTKITGASLKTLKESKYVTPLRFTYEKAERTHDHDFVVGKDSSAVIVYDESMNSLVFVRQFRPDDGETPIAAAAREMCEETGYYVEDKRLEHVHTNISTSGTRRM
ncbi:hypothetical protein MXB_4371 [Myxobolus squamalis]|nr:hypothetical protein MXB_4371 [Myxobolus squamalis]